MIQHSTRFTLAAIAAITCVSVFAAEKYENNPHTGLYQFEKNSVWIRITKEGNAYQCRIGSGQVYRSEGILKIGDEIHWTDHRGIDKLSREGTSILLAGKYGKWSYHLQPTDNVDEQCRATIFPV